MNFILNAHPSTINMATGNSAPLRLPTRSGDLKIAASIQHPSACKPSGIMNNPFVFIDSAHKFGTIYSTLLPEPPPLLNHLVRMLGDHVWIGQFKPAGFPIDKIPETSLSIIN